MPRPNPTDEQGNTLPHTDFDNYGRLEHLVPGAQCLTRAGKIIEWMDDRPQPSYDEIDAVSDADAQAALLPTTDEVLAGADEVVKAILDASPNLRNTVRAQMIARRGK